MNQKRVFLPIATATLRLFPTDEWRDVQNSPAFAAQGYFLSRPIPFEKLESVLTRLS